MSHPTNHRALKRKFPSFVGGKFNGRGLAFFQVLVNLKGVELETVVAVGGRNDELYVLTFFYRDDAGIEFIFFRRNANLAWSRTACSCVLRLGARPADHDNREQ